MIDRRASPAVALLAIACLAPAAMPMVAGASGTAPAVESPVLKRGRLLFLQCIACHDIAAPQQGRTTAVSIEKVGPSLHGVIDRRAGSVADFHYTQALRESRLKWDEATLDRWLEKPTALVPGTAMIYVGMPSGSDRRALIAYLESATRPAHR